MSNRAGHSESDRKNRLGLFIIICIVLMAATAVLTYNFVLGGIDGRDALQAAKSYAEIEQAIRDNYIGEVDVDALHGAASAAMVRAVGDKWSYYMTAEEYASFKLSSANEYAGVGMNIVINGDGDFVIRSVDDGTAAAAAGITAGQRIISVDGSKVKGMDILEVQDLIRSKLNTDFDIVVAGDKGEEMTVKLNCAASYQSPVSFKMVNDDIGYVRIKNFEAGSGDDMITAIQALISSGATSFVFDLRDNPGGLFEELAKALDYLLPDGVLYSTENKDGDVTTVKSDKICLKYKMAVIVNENTYSAAEFFAAAIQDYNWGSVVGTQTSGKARSQITVELSNGGAIHISAGKYLTAKGVDLAEVGGVTPNIISQLDSEKDGDEQLDAAIEALKALS